MNIVQPIRNREDIEKMKAVLKRKKRDLVLFIFGINCGLRISDILKLNVGDVKGRDFVEIKEKKTKKNKRFPLNSELKVVLEDFVKDRPEDEPLFITQQGNRLDRNQAYRILNKAAKTLNLQDKIGTHSLRKTFGYHHYKQFDNIELLQKIFNHSYSAITLRYIGIEQDIIDESYMNFYL